MSGAEGKTYWQEDVNIPLLNVDISRMMLAIIVAIIIIFILAVWLGAKSGSAEGFLQGPQTGVQAYKQLGKFGVGWGVGSIAAMQGSMTAGQAPFNTDDITVQQANFEKHTASKNMARCGKGFWYGEDIVRRADNGTVQMVGYCFPENDTLLNPTGGASPTPAPIPVPAPGASKYQARGYAKLANRKSGFDPQGPEGSGCSEMWGYDADAELGVAVLMSTYPPPIGGSDDAVWNREMESLE